MNGRLGRLAGLVTAILLTLATTALALSTPERNGWVTDEAGILDADTANAIANRLVDLQRQTGAEVVVVTLKSLQGVSIETWGNVLGESWSVGRGGGKDRGVLLVVAPNDRKVRIAVGYGLSSRLPDSVAAVIVADHILPYFRRGEFSQGVKAGVESIALQLESGGASATNVERSANLVPVRPLSFWTWLRHRLTPSHHTLVIAFWVFVAICVFIWMVRNAGNVGSGRRRWSSYGWYTDYGSSSSSSSSWDWGGSSGGSSDSGSSGGGGSFGGGATGSW